MHNDTYLAFSLLMVTLIYPVSCAWVWGDGWLSALEFHDYAGSGVVHLVGGVAGLVQTIMLGPRIGFSKKFDSSKFRFGQNTISRNLLALEKMHMERDMKVHQYNKIMKHLPADTASPV